MSVATVSTPCVAAHGASDSAATQFLHELVATPSVSGDERAAVARFVSGAAALGLHAEIDAAGNGVASTVPRPSESDGVTHGSESGTCSAARTIILLGHIDTVPGDLPVRIEDGILHGRGSVDAKGPLATMLFAAARAKLPEGVAVHVIAAVGEEALSPGANHIARTIRPDACIIGEPSGWDGVTLGYKGCLNVRASVQRSSTHSANPEPTAPDTLFEWWSRVLAFAARCNDSNAPVFDQLQASITSWSASNDGSNDRAALKANFRLPPTLSLAELQRELIALATPTVQLKCNEGEEAYTTTRDDPVVRTLSAAIRNEGGASRHKRKTGTADFNVVAPIWQCPIAAYGPGDSSLDHTPNEHLLLDEYHRSIRVMQGAIELLATTLLEDNRRA
jgi:LysW-gamma-L-lysine carboxypeptidase